MRARRSHFFSHGKPGIGTPIFQAHKSQKSICIEQDIHRRDDGSRILSSDNGLDYIIQHQDQDADIEQVGIGRNECPIGDFRRSDKTPLAPRQQLSK